MSVKPCRVAPSLARSRSTHDDGHLETLFTRRGTAVSISSSAGGRARLILLVACLPPHLQQEVRLSHSNADRERIAELANLYSLILTLDYLERAYVRDSVQAKEYHPKCLKLLQQYKTIVNLLGGGGNVQLDQFMLEYRVRACASSRVGRALIYPCPARTLADGLHGSGAPTPGRRTSDGRTPRRRSPRRLDDDDDDGLTSSDHYTSRRGRGRSRQRGRDGEIRRRNHSGARAFKSEVERGMLN